MATTKGNALAMFGEAAQAVDSLKVFPLWTAQQGRSLGLIGTILLSGTSAARLAPEQAALQTLGASAGMAGPMLLDLQNSLAQAQGTLPAHRETYRVEALATVTTWSGRLVELQLETRHEAPAIVVQLPAILPQA